MRHSVSPRESIEKEQQKTISSTNSNRSKKSASPIVMPPPPVWFIRNFSTRNTLKFKSKGPAYIGPFILQPLF